MPVPLAEQNIRPGWRLARRSAAYAAGFEAACFESAAAERSGKESWHCTGPGSGAQGEASVRRLGLLLVGPCGSCSWEGASGQGKLELAGRMCFCLQPRRGFVVD